MTQSPVPPGRSTPPRTGGGLHPGSSNPKWLPGPEPGNRQASSRGMGLTCGWRGGGSFRKERWEMEFLDAAISFCPPPTSGPAKKLGFPATPAARLTRAHSPTILSCFPVDSTLICTYRIG